MDVVDVYVQGVTLNRLLHCDYEAVKTVNKAD